MAFYPAKKRYARNGMMIECISSGTRGKVFNVANGGMGGHIISRVASGLEEMGWCGLEADK